MNRCYVTAIPPKVYNSAEHALSDWHDGVKFRMYQGYYVSNQDLHRMKASGFTHVCFVFQDEHFQVKHHDLEIKC